MRVEAIIFKEFLSYAVGEVEITVTAPVRFLDSL